MIQAAFKGELFPGIANSAGTELIARQTVTWSKSS